jgi:hypothetical protein
MIRQRYIKRAADGLIDVFLNPLNRSQHFTWDGFLDTGLPDMIDVYLESDDMPAMRESERRLLHQYSRELLAQKTNETRTEGK